MKVALESLGCRVNQYETASIAEELEKLNIYSDEKKKNCDFCIVNSCAVTEEGVRKSRQIVRRLIKNNPKAFVAVMGCASQLHPDDFSNIEGVSFVCGTRNKLSVINAIKSYLSGEEFSKNQVSSPQGEIEKMSISSFERTRAYVKIEDGCQGNCAYCVIPKVRGKITVRNKEEIICEINKLAENGCHEVVLTGIETAAYGSKLAELIKDVSKIDGIERIRLGSMEPSFLKKDFIDAVSSVKEFCPHFHISVQSGSSSVLATMKRKYNREQLLKNIGYIKEKMPNCNLTCDIIVGFPGETENDFNDSVSLVDEAGFLHCHIFRYSKRPYTVAAEMNGQISPEISERRLKILEEHAKASKLKILNSMISSKEIIEILCETKDKAGFVYGHSDGFVECKVKAKSDFIKGGIIKIKPVSVDDGLFLVGEEIND